MGKRGIINPLYGMTDAAFFGKIRAGLRRQWMCSEVYKAAIKRATIDYKEGRRTKKIVCPKCETLYNLKERLLIPAKKKGTFKSVLAYQVDHIDECGSLNSFADMSPFAERLFTGKQETICYHCHSQKEHGKS